MVSARRGVGAKEGIGSRLFDAGNYLLLTVASLVFLYPMLYVVFASLSDGTLLMGHQGPLLAPTGFSLDAYKVVLQNRDIATGYLNTFLILTGGVAVNLMLTSVASYFLSRRNVLFKKPVMVFIVVTMFFSGGLIPFFLTVRDVGLFNNRWALILPTAVNTFNVIVMRTYLQSIPDSLAESAMIDGAGHVRTLFRIILPVSMPVVAVMVLFYGVDHWNEWFNAMIFIRDRAKFPLQLILREVLILSDLRNMLDISFLRDLQEVEETVKYTTIIVSTVPILALYPFLQRYFVKGMMLGALKG